MQSWRDRQHDCPSWWPWQEGQLEIPRNRHHRAAGLSQVAVCVLVSGGTEKSCSKVNSKSSSSVNYLSPLCSFSGGSSCRSTHSGADLASLLGSLDFQSWGEQDWLYDNGHQLCVYLIKLSLLLS